MSTLQFSNVDDPNEWVCAEESTLKVGDVFTEEWLDRFRDLMHGYDELKKFALWAEDAGGDDAAEIRLKAARVLLRVGGES